MSGPFSGRRVRRWLCGGAWAVALWGAPSALADRAGAKTVGEVLGNWRQAVGGTPRLSALTAIDCQQKIEFGNGKSTIDVHVTRHVSGQYRCEIFNPQTGRLVQGYDGRSTWMSSDRLGFGLVEQGTPFSMERPDEAWFAMAMDRLFPRQTLLEDAVVDGKPCSVLGLSHAGVTEEKWYFDQHSSQLVRVEQIFPGDRAKNTLLDYSDFRTVGGITLPFTAKETHAGSAVIARRLAASINVPLGKTYFSPSVAQLKEAAFISSIMARHLDSLGGWTAGAAIHSRITHLSIDVLTSGVKSQVSVSQKAPNLIVTETQSPGMGRSVEGYDGVTGWANSEIEGFRVLKATEALQLATQADLLVEFRLGQRSPLRKYLGSLTIDGSPTYAVSLANPTGRLGTYYFDQITGRLLRISAAKIGDASSSLIVTSDYSDFRTVDGVEIPFKITMTNPAMKLVTTVESVQNNVTLDNGIFKPQRDD